MDASVLGAPRRPSTLKRPRMATAEQFVADALSAARLTAHRCWDTLELDPTCGEGEAAIQRQAHLDGLDAHDIAEARDVVLDATRRYRMLDASAIAFEDAAAASLMHRAARGLQIAAEALDQRVNAFAHFAAPHEAPADDDDDLDAVLDGVTEAQAHVLETRRPVLQPMRRREGAGRDYLGLSDTDLETVYEIYADWKWPQRRIADMLGCSTRKLRELLHAAGLARPAPDIARIEEVVQSSMLDMNAGVGVRRIVGHLTTQRVPFTWAAVAEIMRTIDPVGRDLRFRRAIPRVHYNVHEALGMWHFDGYEHLVAWNIYIHGVIDGGTRFVVSANATDNKDAHTVAGFMIKRIAELGVPRKIRADKGTENVHVERFVALLRDAGYKVLYIKGPSTRNQRIERWWGDLCPYITPIATVLQALGDAGVLDMTRPDHHTALHLIVLPYVNRVLESVVAAWNNHRVSTDDMRCTPAHKFSADRFRMSRRDRLQELVVEPEGAYVAAAPAYVASLAAAAEAAGLPPPTGSYTPSDGLEGIDEWAASVLRDKNSQDTWRTPMSEPAEWFTGDVRAAIARAVTPLVPGKGPLLDELRWRFELALTFLQVLDAHAQRGGAVDAQAIAAVAALYCVPGAQ